MYWDAIGTIFSTERTRSMLDRDRDLAMVVLLCEGSGSMMKEVYRRCSVRIMADGGSNCFYDALSEEERSQYLPDCIVGDMDSIRDDVLQHYRDKNVKILESDCKCTTDFDKSLVYLRRLEDLGAGHRPESDYLKGCYECSRSMHRAPMDSSALHEGKRYDIAVLCSTAGRLDQMIGTLNSLTTLEPERRAYLIMGSNIVFLLKGGEHTIIHTSPIEGPHCGLVPLSQEPLRVRTQGLVWDIRGDTEMGFGSLISTNNLLDLERSGAETNGSRSRALCAVGKVQLSTTGNVVWMVSFDYSKIGLLKAGRRGSVGG